MAVQSDRGPRVAETRQGGRSPDGHYRTTPLKGLWAHSKGGYYHDGRFATLREVVDLATEGPVPAGPSLRRPLSPRSDSESSPEDARRSKSPSTSGYPSC